MQDANWIEIFNGTTGTGTPIPCAGAESASFEYDVAANTTAGAGTLEHASTVDYAGTWTPLETFQIGAGGGTVLTANAKVATLNFPVGPMGFIRFRTTTNFSGGASPGIVVRATRKFRG